jgi:hypothetical protein
MADAGRPRPRLSRRRGWEPATLRPRGASPGDGAAADGRTRSARAGRGSASDLHGPGASARDDGRVGDGGPAGG